MPSKAYDLNQPSLYLDTAALSYAFNATHGPGADVQALAGAKPLAAFVEKVAKQHNLCVSLIHMKEIARWEDANAPGIAFDMAKWLDSLPLVWTRSVQHALADEEEAAVECALGGSRRPAPWASCFSAALETPMSLEKRVSFLRLANMPAVVTAFRSAPDDRDGDTLMHYAVGLFENNEWADEQGWTKAKKADWTARQRDAGVAEALWKAVARLGLQNREGIGDVVSGIVRDFARAPFETLRVRAVQKAGIDDFCMKARGSRIGDSHRSTLFDIVHAALGAAYATVFTCDRRTAPFVARARESLKMLPPIVNAPTISFLEALEAARSESASRLP